MKKDLSHFMAFCCIFPIILAGCILLPLNEKHCQTLSEQYSKLEETYNNCLSQNIELEERYNQLHAQYIELESAYNDAIKKQATPVLSPSIKVSLIDDNNDYLDLTLCSSLEESYASYTDYYYNPNRSETDYSSFTISCTNEQKIDEVYWVKSSGEIISITESVNNLDTIYTFSLPTAYNELQSLIIKLGEETIYSSFIGVN